MFHWSTITGYTSDLEWRRLLAPVKVMTFTKLPQNRPGPVRLNTICDGFSVLSTSLGTCWDAPRKTGLLELDCSLGRVLVVMLTARANAIKTLCCSKVADLMQKPLVFG